MASKEFDVCLESDLPIVQQQGLNTLKPVTFNSTVTVSGAMSVGGGITATGVVNTTGVQTANSATALTGTGTQGMGFSTIANFGIYWGTGIPTVTAATGSLYMNYGGTGVASRLYVNSGTTNWVAVTTVS